MATVRVQDRLQPALLDRLTDDDPGSTLEALDARAIHRNRLREMVLRDLSWIFNCNAPSGDFDGAGLEHVRRSVLNYGLVPMSGISTSSIDTLVLQQRVRQAILDFEPRILPDTLTVEVVDAVAQMDHHNQLGFRIAGQLWAQPVPLELLLHTDIDLETGRVSVQELDR